jgi:hypothetical protein
MPPPLNDVVVVVVETETVVVLRIAQRIILRRDGERNKIDITITIPFVLGNIEMEFLL